MQKYQSTTPDWLYLEPNIDLDALDQIKKELLRLSIDNRINQLVPSTSTFVTASKELAQKTCPTLIKELERLKLLKIFYFVAFVSVTPDKYFPAHVDVGTDVGLNIPITNCEGTYTVWYDARINDTVLPDYIHGSKISFISRGVDSNTAVEIGRRDASKPHWLNTNVPHRPETTHQKFRLSASLRFQPEPIDANGNLWPHLIK